MGRIQNREFEVVFSANPSQAKIDFWYLGFSCLLFVVIAVAALFYVLNNADWLGYTMLATVSVKFLTDFYVLISILFGKEIIIINQEKLYFNRSILWFSASNQCAIHKITSIFLERDEIPAYTATRRVSWPTFIVSKRPRTGRIHFRYEFKSYAVGHSLSVEEAVTLLRLLLQKGWLTTTQLARGKIINSPDHLEPIEPGRFWLRM